MLPSPRRRLLRPALVPLLTALLAAVSVPLSLPLAGPASATPTGSTSTGDVVLYDHCQHHEISYDLAVDPGTVLWRLEIQVVDPHGITSEGYVVNSATNPSTSGTTDNLFCGSEPTGTYRVRATGFYELLPLVEIPYTLPETTFTVRPVRTRTDLTSRPLGRGRYEVVTRVRQEAEHGYERADGVPVRLERRVHGRWQRVPGLTLTTVHGRAAARIHGHPGDRFRAVVRSRPTFGGSTSQPIAL